MAASQQVKSAPQIQPVPDEQTQLEPMYRVIIHNDDVTPMDFVVNVLKKFFFLDEQASVAIMFEAHTTGAAYVQSLPRSEAQKRIARAHFAAGLEGYPLRFTMEPE